MAMPVRALPVVQNWDCHACGDCCRHYSVRATPEEAARIESQNWGFAGAVPDGRGGLELAHRPNGDCVFLGEQNRCAIHAKFGAAAKPLACRMYPFTLVPVGDHWRVSVRLACPSACANLGATLESHAGEIAGLSRELEADTPGAAASRPAPDLRPGQSLAWPDLLRVNDALVGLILDPRVPVERRLRQILALSAVCRKARFDALSGKRLSEFLGVVRQAACEDVPADPAGVAAPSWLGRVLFRQFAAVYARQDHGAEVGIARRGRWTRLKAAWRFAVGEGRIPALHARIGAVEFRAAEEPWGDLPPESEELLARFYFVKLNSLQFTGTLYHGRAYWAGVDALVLTYPVVRWLARVLHLSGLSRPDAVAAAVRQVDDHYGFNPILGSPRQLWAVDRLAERGELARLVAHYGR